MKTIKVVGAVLDDKQLLLYKEDGNTISILQGDIRLQKVLDSVVPQINRQGWAEIKEEQMNSFAGFEKKTGIKFFRVLKEAVDSLFSNDADREHVDTTKPISVGKVPSEDSTMTSVSTSAQVDNQTSAIAKVQATVRANSVPTTPRKVPKLGEGLLTHATPVKEGDGPIQQHETIVAVVGDTMIPGMEKLKGQLDHVARGHSSKGMENLIARLGKMIDKRGHSVEDILRFLERGDLPIADDGAIIAYKVLKTGASYESLFEKRAGLFFDCHTGKVPQQVGSVVRVDEALVDKNRRNECSNGLHIARRGYIGSFSGDVLVLCRIEPEDIITVPHNDPNKVRVCAYHIIAQISEQDHRTLRSNKPMTDNDAAQILLGRALVGDHIGKIEEVRITEQRGGGIVTKALIDLNDFNYIVSKDQKATASTEKTKPTAPVQPMESKTMPSRKKAAPKKATALTLDGCKDGPKVDPKAVAVKQAAVKRKADEKKPATKPIKAAMAAPKKAPVSKTPEATKAAQEPPMKSKPGKLLTRAEEAQILYNQMNDTSRDLYERKSAAVDLLAFKKAAKVSWIALGFKLSADVPAQIETVINIPETAKAPAKAKSPVKSDAKPAKPQKAEGKAPKAAKPKANAPAAVPAAKSVKAPAKPVKEAVTAADLSETDVLRQVKDGKLSKAEAARKLGTSPRSIDRKLAKLS